MYIQQKGEHVPERKSLQEQISFFLGEDSTNVHHNK